MNTIRKNQVDRFLKLSAEIKLLQKKQKEEAANLIEAMVENDVDFLAGVKKGDGVTKSRITSYNKWQLTGITPRRKFCV
mgnify:FL=1